MSRTLVPGALVLGLGCLASPLHAVRITEAPASAGVYGAASDTFNNVWYTAGNEFHCDFVIVGTGYFVDLAARPELADFHDKVLLWRDRFTPAVGDEDEFLGAHPYLGAGHEYLEKVPRAAPYLRNVHVQNPAGFVSFGLPIGDIPSMKRDVPTIVSRISNDLFMADIADHERRMSGDVAPDFGPEAYARAVRSA